MAARIVTRLHRVLSEKMEHRGPPQEWVADRKGIYTPGAVAPMFFNVDMSVWIAFHGTPSRRNAIEPIASDIRSKLID